jgi:hypothetical protein
VTAQSAALKLLDLVLVRLGGFDDELVDYSFEESGCLEAVEIA